MLLAAIDIATILSYPIMGLDVKSWAIIAVVAFLVFTKKIDITKIFSPTPPAPPGPNPPAPGPIPGVDWSNLVSTLMPLLFHLFMKAEATGDEQLKTAVATVAMHSSLPLNAQPQLNPATTFQTSTTQVPVK